MTTIVRPRSTKKYHALIALGMTDEQALDAIAKLAPEPEVVPEFPVIEQLVASGAFTREEAEALVASLSADEPTHVAPTPAPAPAPVVLTPKQRAEELVTKSGLGYTRGRTYLDADMLESAARVLKTGTPEICRMSGEGHIAAVLMYREDGFKNVAVQNLAKPKE